LTFERRMHLVVLEYLSRVAGWVCSQCGGPIDPALKHPRNKRASVDHVVPVSRGGMNVLENLALTHLGCNSQKGNEDRGRHWSRWVREN